ncbi:MAG: M15 family metallopeptidase [Muribaculaceae bacterium]|nr:M15 family metallopeptidase [Muribaculaceae bacterium]
MKKNLQNQLLKSIFFLFALIIVCAFFVHLLTDSETLSDYAADNPELAYGNSATHIDESSEKSDEEMNPEMNQNDTISDTHTDAATPADRVIYQEGFYYEPLTDEVKQRITGISYPVSASEAASSAVPVFNMLADNETPAVSYEELRYLSVLYYDFNGEVQTGELICNRGIVEDLVDIFYELYVNEYQIEKIRLIDEYQGDDTASMTDNNTSCFNYRVVDGTASLSKHALGCAIDINPFYNPYIVFNRDGNGEDYISPAGSEIYADRSKDFPYKIDETDLCYKLFTEHGFTWGGNWNSCKDYQHFQKVVE